MVLFHLDQFYDASTMGISQKSHESRSFNRLRQHPLVSGGVSCDPARHDLPTLGDEITQYPVILIVYV